MNNLLAYHILLTYQKKVGFTPYTCSQVIVLGLFVLLLKGACYVYVYCFSSYPQRISSS
jgi:hypothetical protein